jgi:citrate synthase
MTQFSAGVLMCQPDSHFAKAYANGVHKSKYWEATFEDALDLCAKVSRIAAIVYHNRYRKTADLPQSVPGLDYGANFAHMLGYSSAQFAELMRLYLVIHA